MFLVLLAIAGFVLGAVVRHWAALSAAVLVPAYFAGLHAELWGSGVGDFWALAALIDTLVALAAVAAGIATGRALAAVTRRPAG